MVGERIFLSSCAEVDELLGSDPSASRFMELQDGMTGCRDVGMALVWKCGFA